MAALLVRSTRVLLMSAILCALIGCATRGEYVFHPLALAASDASQVDMLVATTRKQSENLGQLYTGGREAAISLNRIVVSIPPDRNPTIGKVQWPLFIKPDPEKDFAVRGKLRSRSAGEEFSPSSSPTFRLLDSTMDGKAAIFL
ncbi:hypothetical protein [Mesorhizobium sophorae]|uniref:hypothetical protein n=1 Tax=Mesorhizobium sophorae TaxID=1300294 RepID=UPI000BA47BB2|nr:hypothetical protein [Mesorhizobium sophorae]